MVSTEFDLIRRYFVNHEADQQPGRADVALGIGDDAALLSPPPGQTLVVTADTLVSGVHFPKSSPPDTIGHKALAVNLSDLAAMGAEPAWFTLAITLPESDTDWLSLFAQGLYALANEHNIQLVGGDTTRGPLSITIQAIGFVPEGEALTRAGANVGDNIYVTGTLGDAGAGLKIKQGQFAPTESVTSQLVERLEKPTPRVSAGMDLRKLATSAIDISDGLVADLGHVLRAGNVGADVIVDTLPLSDAFQELDIKEAWQLAVSAGDDYELCFTADPSCEAELQQCFDKMGNHVTCIGVITPQPGVIRWLDGSGNEIKLTSNGYEHFSESN